MFNGDIFKVHMNEHIRLNNVVLVSLECIAYIFLGICLMLVLKRIQQQVGIQSHYTCYGRLTKVIVILVVFMAYNCITNFDVYKLHMGDEKVSNNFIDKIY